MGGGQFALGAADQKAETVGAQKIINGFRVVHLKRFRNVQVPPS